MRRCRRKSSIDISGRRGLLLFGRCWRHWRGLKLDRQGGKCEECIDDWGERGVDLGHLNISLFSFCSTRRRRRCYRSRCHCRFLRFGLGCQRRQRRYRFWDHSAVFRLGLYHN